MSSPSIQNPYSAQDEVVVGVAASATRHSDNGIDIDGLVEEVQEVDHMVARRGLNESR